VFFFSRVVNHENINKADYCTISQKGVTRIRNDDETEFVTLDRWELEYNYFTKLIKVELICFFHAYILCCILRG